MRLTRARAMLNNFSKTDKSQELTVLIYIYTVSLDDQKVKIGP